MTKEQLQLENEQLLARVASLESTVSRLRPLLEASVRWISGESDDAELAASIRKAMEPF